mmetsp:Transcript_95539/g.279388  ORF Transcript_95539/g.279388 Transcript_95539/m.279388 type:complete len:204 (-) Transcript_95539:392-1003(-)
MAEALETLGPPSALRAAASVSGSGTTGRSRAQKRLQALGISTRSFRTSSWQRSQGSSWTKAGKRRSAAGPRRIWIPHPQDSAQHETLLRTRPRGPPARRHRSRPRRALRARRTIWRRARAVTLLVGHAQRLALTAACSSCGTRKCPWKANPVQSSTGVERGTRASGAGPTPALWPWTGGGGGGRRRSRAAGQGSRRGSGRAGT